MDSALRVGYSIRIFAFYRHDVFCEPSLLTLQVYGADNQVTTPPSVPEKQAALLPSLQVRPGTR
jgi:hypothetical protein